MHLRYDTLLHYFNAFLVKKIGVCCCYLLSTVAQTTRKIYYQRVYPVSIYVFIFTDSHFGRFFSGQAMPTLLVKKI